MEVVEEGVPIIFSDETWLFRRGVGSKKHWQDTDLRSAPEKHASKGGRNILVHAGSKDGFVGGAKLVYPSFKKPKNDDDYHGDMDGATYLKWVKEKLLPNLPEKCALVVDNAAYHSCQVSDNSGLKPPLTCASAVRFACVRGNQLTFTNSLSFPFRSRILTFYGAIIKVNRPKQKGI